VMSAQVEFVLVGSDDRPIRGEARIVPGGAPAIVLSHGFKGFARWGFFPWLAEQFVAAGFTAITFDYTGSGVGADRENFTEPDAFATDTFGKELHDLNVVFRAAEARGWITGARGLFGFSRGGGVAVLRAARDARLGALVTWSSISTVERWSPAQIDAWRRAGYVEVVNSRTGQMLRVTTAVLDEIESKGGDELNIPGAASRVAVPWLIVHGESDETVPVDEGRRLHGASRGGAELMLVPGATHTYGATHGMRSATAELQAATDRTIEFFRAKLR